MKIAMALLFRDRAPYITRRGASEPAAGITPSTNYISRNFIINYGSSAIEFDHSIWNIDHGMWLCASRHR